MATKNKRAKKRKNLVNVDTVEFDLKGMDFKNCSDKEVNLIDTRTGQITSRYGNYVGIKKKSGAHKLMVRTMESGEKFLRILGSPFAYECGQNLYTCGDVLRGCRIAINAAIKNFGIQPSSEMRSSWLLGNFNLNRVDLAVNFRLSSEAEVIEVLKQLRRQLGERGVNSRIFAHSFYYQPKGGKEYSMIFYAKGAHLRRLKNYQKMAEKEKLVAEAECILRVELRLNAGELRKLGLEKASSWTPETANKVFGKYMSRMKFLEVTSGIVTDEELEALPSRLRPVLVAHKAGLSLSRVYPKRTLQRHMKDFRDLKIDLRCPNQPNQRAVSLPSLLRPGRAISSPPKWMVDAKMVPKPRRARARLSRKVGRKG